MLGAAHALANPLTAHHRVIHGQAVGLMLPHVVRFNAPACGEAYADLLDDVGVEAHPATAGEHLADWLAGLLARSPLESTLHDCGIETPSVTDLAIEAAGQWTAGFNPRPLTTEDLAALYEAAR